MTARVITGRLHRVQRGHGTAYLPEPPAQLAPVRRPARVALMLALAHAIRAAIGSGKVADQAEVARRLGFTPARVTQLLDLLQLAPDIQEQVLFLETVDGIEPLAERQLRPLVRVPSWGDQRTAFAVVART